MRFPVRPAPWCRAVRLLERALLGRASVRPVLAVASALAQANDRHWCLRCGVPLPGAREMPSRVAVGQGPRCAACERLAGFAAFVRLGRYRPPLDGLLRRAKDRGDHAIVRELGRRLGDEVARRLQSPPGGWCVVPVPSSPARRFARGIDHAFVLAEAAARQLGSPTRSAIRSTWRSRQAALGRRERLGRAAGFRPGRADPIRGRHVLLVDDIRTTGATLTAAASLLRSMGAASVSAAVVAVAEIDA